MIAALVDHLWQSTLFACGAGALTVLFRRNGAHVRYGLWFAASMKFLIPFSLLFALGRALAPRVGTIHGLPFLTFIERVGSPLPYAIATPFAALTPPLQVISAPALPEIAATVWAAGCLAVMILWLSRWARVTQLARNARRLPVAAPIPIVASPSSVEPGVVGLVRPVLVLPEGLAERLSDAEFRAVLAHELCHVRRRDNLTAATHMLVEAVFWFFPLVWWVGARLILERERACDESVLADGNDSGTYAESILKVCKFYMHSPAACMAGVSGADLKRRIEAIMIGHETFRLGFFQRLVLALAAGAALIAPLAFGFLSIRTATAASGDQTDLSPQTIDARRYEQARPRTEIAYNPTDFDKFVGYYQLAPTVFFHITRDGSHYWSRMTGQQGVEIYPDSATEFFTRIIPIPAQIAFEQSADGTVTGLALHQNGLVHSAKRVDAAIAEQAQAALTARIQSNTPSPGTEAAVRHQIDALGKGQADYSAMSPELATMAAQQASMASQTFGKLGAFQSLTFNGVGAQGEDVYQATFARGEVEFRIAPLGPDGKIQGLLMRALP